MKNLLIKGRPGIGKTTLIKRLSKALIDLNPKGFYTEEIREKGGRVGFEIKGLDGRAKGILAHINFKSEKKVGKYGVNIKEFENFLLEIKEELFRAKLVIIDEIGKMESFSPLFMEIVKDCLQRDIIFLATLSQAAGSFFKEIENRRDVLLYEITIENRDHLPSKIERWVRERI